jgi:hypothetical protein
VISAFGGLAPRLGDDQLPVGAARVARDLWLSNGGIRPWRTPLELCEASPGDVSLFVEGCRVRLWDKIVRACDWLPDEPMLIVVGRSWRPEVLIGDDYHPLGVPAPETAPTVSGSESYGETSDMRTYCLTWVNALGRESAPSPPSRSAPVRDGDPVVVSNLPAPPGGWEIEALRVYRTATGWRAEGEEGQAEPITAWLLVGELPAGETFLVDQLLARELGPILETHDDRPPPNGLAHVARLEDTGVLVGAAGNRVHFSDNYHPWAWPATLDIGLDDRVVNLCVVGTTVFATTEGRPVVIDASNYCEPAAPRPAAEVSAAPPDIGRGHARSACATPFGMVYSSADGLILLKADASFDVLTASWHDRATWSVLRPETARVAYWRGRVFCATDAATLVLEIDSKTFGDSEAGILTTLSLSPSDMHVPASGSLAMLEGGRVIAFDQGDGLMPWVWESSPMRMSGEATFNALRVRPSGAGVTLRGRRGETWTGRVPDGNPVRIGRLGRSRELTARLEGHLPVDRLELSASLATLGSEE